MRLGLDPDLEAPAPTTTDGDMPSRSLGAVANVAVVASDEESLQQKDEEPPRNAQSRQPLRGTASSQ